jgi:hypothetical protein
MTVRIREGNGNLKEQHQIVLCGELAFKSAVDLCRKTAYITLSEVGVVTEVDESGFNS